MQQGNLTEVPTGPNISVIMPGLAGWIGGAFATIATWNQRHRSRMQMAGIDKRILSDFGISPTDIFIETNKPFWEA
jgi:uncharacterized protein YjiS (DUF1127 family)